LEDADGRVRIFQTYEEAMQRYEEMNAKLMDSNFRYSVEGRPTNKHFERLFRLLND
jgi:hypothetical protein